MRLGSSSLRINNDFGPFNFEPLDTFLKTSFKFETYIISDNSSPSIWTNLTISYKNFYKLINLQYFITSRRNTYV